MQWYDAFPYVAPYVIGCSEPVMTHHLRLAAIEFCRKTLCWTQWLDEGETDGTSAYEMDAGRNAQIIKVKTVLVDGKEFAIAETRHGISLEASEDQSTNRVHTVDNQTLFINPVQEEGLTVQILAALAPSRTAQLMDDAIADHVQDIAEGAIASIMRLTQQEFTNMADSSVHETIFRERIKSIGAKTGRGLLAAKITRKPRFI